MSCAIGIDVGGTKIAAGLVEVDTARVLTTRRVPTNVKRGGTAVLKTVIDLVDDLRAEGLRQRMNPQRIGVGLPELVSLDGRLMSDGCFGWEKLRAREKLNSILPTVFEADVRAAAAAEAKFGAGVGLTTFVYVTIGTGISCCLVIEGKPFLGARGLTGTFASAPCLIATEKGIVTKGIALEDFASGFAIARRHRLGDAKKIFQRAEVGHVDATEIVASSGFAIGAGVAALVNILDPEKVVIGGGLGLSENNTFQRAIKHGFQQHVWSKLHLKVPLVSAKLGPDSGIIGAALAAVA